MNIHQKMQMTITNSFQGVKRLFVLAFSNSNVNDNDKPINNTNNRVVRDSYKKDFIPIVNITNYNY